MLRVAIDVYELDTGGSELPTDHFCDWLAEWGREARRKQTGLMLVTAHRAKGLEFDHVAVLDGGWRSDDREDGDSVRRLYYVAMTRARKSLVLARTDAGISLLDELPDMPCLLRRPTLTNLIPDVSLDRQYQLPALKEINIGYAGRYESGDAVHEDIARLTYGSPLALQTENGVWCMLDEQGRCVGKMAKTYSPPRGMQCVGARVHAIIVWKNAADADSKYRAPKCERWEVVVPELVFAKNSQS
jgi:ATP-dependent DNA helicase RecQ